MCVHIHIEARSEPWMSFPRHHVCVCVVPVCLYMHHGYSVTEATRRGLRCPLELEYSSAIDNCNPLGVYAYWEPNLTPLPEHQLLNHLSSSYLVFLRQCLLLTWSPLTRANQCAQEPCCPRLPSTGLSKLCHHAQLLFVGSDTGPPAMSP